MQPRHVYSAVHTGAVGEESGMARHAAAADPMFP